MLIDPGLLQRYLYGLTAMRYFDPPDEDLERALGWQGVTPEERKAFRLGQLAAYEGAMMLLKALLKGEDEDDPSA